MRDVTSQELSDCGINPFAAKLITESWHNHPKKFPVAFRFGGVEFAIGYDPHQLLAACEAAYAQMSGDGENDLEPWQAAMSLLESAIATAKPKPCAIFIGSRNS